MIEPFGVFAQDGHVNHAGFPNLTESSVNLVGYAFVEFDGSHIRVQIQSASQTQNDRTTCKVPVGKMGPGVANGSKEDGVGVVPAKFKRAFSPLFSCGFVVLTAAFDDRLREPVIGVGLDRVEDTLSFQRNFSPRAVPGEYRDAMVTHGPTQMTRLHEQNPWS